MLTVTPLYAGLLALLFLLLSLRVVQGRRRHKISVGDHDNKDMIKRMRVQANCAEYAPIGVLLLAFAEIQGAAFWVVHLAGISLLTGRALHAFGLGSTPQVVPARQAGMYLTVGMILVMACLNIAFSLDRIG